MTKKEELEAREIEGKYGTLSEAEKEEEARRLLEYEQYHARRAGQYGGGMWE